MRVSHIHETVIYAGDLQAAAAFYQEVLGLELLHRYELLLVFDCEPGVLLIFDPEQSRQSDRDVPSHGPQGPGHLAFRVESSELEAWRRHLTERGIAIEQEVDWNGAASIYFRDPAGNSLELITGQIWGE